MDYRDLIRARDDAQRRVKDLELTLSAIPFGSQSGIDHQASPSNPSVARFAPRRQTELLEVWPRADCGSPGGWHRVLACRAVERCSSGFGTRRIQELRPWAGRRVGGP
jgi:hypothetical protein